MPDPRASFTGYPGLYHLQAWQEKVLTKLHFDLSLA